MATLRVLDENASVAKLRFWGFLYMPLNINNNNTLISYAGSKNLDEELQYHRSNIAGAKFIFFIFHMNCTYKYNNKANCLPQLLSSFILTLSLKRKENM
ncbi:hypothetical protein GDO86_001055 [Hymenochirus boettgeri]|uniref:Uncharacterized protein n=1 Tax=Hymenochirus boettgeri TaxID=247094 RepID=A0A8T2KH15_9PIPI|nr:hypothetical protein GDO86_001055 [Hymenochirus boettgeri]